MTEGLRAPPADGDMEGLRRAVDRLQEALVRSTGRALFVSRALPEGARLQGRFEVRDCRGKVKRLQEAALPLPLPLFWLVTQAGAPSELIRIEAAGGRIALWPAADLIELQVGYRWHGFTGRQMTDWDGRFVVFAEDEGEPLALRLDEDNGPVWSAPRSDGRYDFSVRSPSLADFLTQLAEAVEAGAAACLPQSPEFSALSQEPPERSVPKKRGS